MANHGQKGMKKIYGVYGKICFFLPASHSLKDRRKIVQSLSELLRRNCKASVADVSQDGTWQRGELHFAIVASGMKDLRYKIEQMQRIMDRYEGDLEILEVSYDYMP